MIRFAFRRVLPVLLGIFLIYFVYIFVAGWRQDWVPETVVALEASPQTGLQGPIQDSVISLLIWNVGYGGLGASSDFFYDDEGMWYSGGSMIRSPRAAVEENIAGAVSTLQQNKSDILLLQEVDVASDRSYQLPQFATYTTALAPYTATMAYNYRCPRVPIPLLKPWNAYENVQSRLGTFSKYQPTEATRYQLPGEYPMPDRMFQLDRCAALHRYATRYGKDLVVINIHNSAYDPGDKIKAQQLVYLRELAVQEYAKGNFVVLGGDWNQCPPHVRFDLFMPGRSANYEQGNIPADFFPEDWVYAYDPTVPTNRKCKDVYQPNNTFVTLIDYFLEIGRAHV